MRSDQPGYLQMVGAAFFARPDWLFVPPNWLGLAAFAGLGLLNPGFWLLGAGLEIAYLHLLASNPRFKKLVQAGAMEDQSSGPQGRLETILAALDGEGRGAYESLKRRCTEILNQLNRHTTGGIDHQRDALQELLWVHLRLLQTAASIRRVMNSSGTGKTATSTLESIQKEIENLEKRLAKSSGEDMAKSLEARMTLLRQREAAQMEGAKRLEYLSSEVARIKDQVEWIGEQSMLASQVETVSHRIDEVAGSFHETARWLAENQRIYGEVEAIVDTPPPILLAETEK